MNGKWVLCVGSTRVRRSIRKSYQSDVRLALPHHSFELTGETDGWEIVFLLRWHKRITDLPNYRLPPTDTTRFVFGSHTASAKICLYLLLLLMRIFFCSACRRFVSCCRHVASKSPNGIAFVICQYLMLGVSLDFCVFGYFVAYYCWLISVGCVQRLLAFVYTRAHWFQWYPSQSRSLFLNRFLLHRNETEMADRVICRSLNASSTTHTFLDAIWLEPLITSFKSAISLLPFKQGREVSINIFH